MLGVCIGDGAGKSSVMEWNVSFSEDHMSLRNSFHFSQNAGGEYTMSMAYLLAWQGPVLEEEDPYGDGYSPDALSPACRVQEIQVPPEKDYRRRLNGRFICTEAFRAPCIRRWSVTATTRIITGKRQGRTGMMAMRSKPRCCDSSAG